MWSSFPKEFFGKYSKSLIFFSLMNESSLDRPFPIWNSSYNPHRVPEQNTERVFSNWFQINLVRGSPIHEPACPSLCHTQTQSRRKKWLIFARLIKLQTQFMPNYRIISILVKMVFSHTSNCGFWFLGVNHRAESLSRPVWLKHQCSENYNISRTTCKISKITV